jgi:hypothetical protein
MSEITNEIKKELGGDIEKKLNLIPEIQCYADHELLCYLWRDLRFKDTSDGFRHNNNRFDTRGELKEAIINHLKSVGDL